MSCSRRAHVLVLALSVVAITTPLTGHASGAASSKRTEGASFYVRPTARLQTRTFTASAHGGDCRAFAQPARARVSCTLEVTVELRGRGASPMQTGSSLLRGRKVQTAYASIGVCLSGPSLVHPSTCMTDVQGCQIPTTKSVPDCYPSWAARVATQFQYDGRQVRRIWLDPCCDIGLGFALKESRAFSLPRSNVAGKPLAIGMDVAVTGTVPIARAIRSTYTLRIMALPNGGAVFQVR